MTKRSYPGFFFLTVTEPRRKMPDLLIFEFLAPQRFRLVCFCDEKKKRPDGACIHTDMAFEGMKPWYRTRCRVVRPFPDEVRA